MSDDEKLSYDTNSCDDDNPRQLLLRREILRSKKPRGVSLHIVSLYSMIFILLTAFVVFFAKQGGLCHNPSLQLYCTYFKQIIDGWGNFSQFAAPANDIVRYKTVTFDGYFFEPSPYTRLGKEEKNKNWEALYQCKYDRKISQLE